MMDKKEWVQWRSSLSDAEYAAHLVEKAQPSVEGSNGSRVAFAIATLLWENFDDLGVVEAAMRLYNDTKCSPKWSDKELQHKIESAADKLGSAIGCKKWRGGTGGSARSGVAPMRLGVTTAPKPVEIRPSVVPSSPKWGEMAERLLSKCNSNYLEKQDSSADYADWLYIERGIDPRLAVGLGVGYSDRPDYAVAQSIFGTPKPATIYNGYTVPSRNVAGQAVGVMFIRPSQPKEYRYMQLLGGCNYFFGTDWLAISDPRPRVVLILEGTINWFSAIQTIGGAEIDDLRTVVLGAPSATTPIDVSIIESLRPNDIVIALTDSDDAGRSGAERWCDAIEAHSQAVTGNVVYPSLGTAEKVDFNDLLLAERRREFDIKLWWAARLAAIKKGLS